MIILKMIGLVFWLLVIPVGLGLLFRKAPKWEHLPKKLQTAGVTLLIGYLLLFALLEMVGIPVMLLSVYHGYSRMVILYAALQILGAGAGYGFWIYLGKKTRKTNLSGALKETGHFLWLRRAPYDSWEGRLLLVLFLLLVGFQLYMAFTRASFDGDDAYYVVHSLITQQSDTMYIIQPSTGRSTSLDIRHALAVFPMWAAYLGRMSKIHATIISHSVLPLALLPLSYLLYYQIGKRLLQNKKDSLPMFMILMALLQMFGNISIYTNETFLMTRTWQGKSFAGNFVMPAVIWLFLCIADEEPAKDGALQKGRNKDGNKGRYAKQSGYWLLLVLVNTCAGLSSSLAVFLCAMLTGILGFLLALRERRFSILVKAGLSCIPSAVYILLYLFLHV